MPLPSFCCWAGLFESYQVANLEDRLSRDEAQVVVALASGSSGNVRIQAASEWWRSIIDTKYTPLF